MSDERRISTNDDVFAPAHIMAWLKMKPSDEKYDIHDWTDCLLARYAKNTFGADVELHASWVKHRNREYHYPQAAKEAAFQNETYGSALGFMIEKQR